VAKSHKKSWGGKFGNTAARYSPPQKKKRYLKKGKSAKVMSKNK
jgi:hypothetical protein